MTGRVIPGLGLSLGITLAMLAAIVLLPLAAIFVTAAGQGWDEFAAAALSTRALAAYRLTFLTAGVAALVNALFGLVTAWVLVRYDFPGKRLVSGLVDLPFALPTAVAGIALTALYGPTGWLGSRLEAAGINVAFTPLGIIVALVFVGLPFAVRTVEPVLADLAHDVEEAAATLGATRWQTIARVVIPALLPAIITGFTLGLARGLGEYGSVIFIAGNMPWRTEIAPLLVVVQLEQYSVAGAAAIAATLMLFSFCLLLAINIVQGWQARRMEASR